jgi:hypothetical protein
VHAAAREARNDAAPFALVAAAILIALALVAKHAHWQALGQSLWLTWLIVAGPYLCLAATLLLGLNRLVGHDHRREIVIGLLGLVWVFNVLGVVVLVASLVAHSAIRITGPQLLASGGAVWLTNAIAFGLAFSGNSTAAAQSRGPSQRQPANPTSSFPRTRTLSSPATGGRLDSGTTFTSR